MVLRKSLLAAGACLALTSFAFSAQAAPPGPYVNAGATYERFDHNRHLDDTLGEQLGIGYNFTKQFGLEADFRHLNPDGKHSYNPGSNLWTGEVNALYYLIPDATVQPFILGGIDYNQFHYAHMTDSRKMGGVIGVGALVNVTRDLAVRGDIRAEHPLLGLDRYDARAFLGLQYSFGAATQPRPQPVAAAPAPARRGPPPDADHDGVPDNRDQCPNTPAGAKVNNRGCQVYLKKAVTHTLHVQFALESAKIKNKYDNDIASLAHFLRQYPSATTILKGYTDTTGPASYNLKLSEQRAESVRNRLIKKYNIPATRLKSKGFGERNPVASNATRSGREQNRRVVAVSRATKKVPANNNNNSQY